MKSVTIYPYFKYGRNYKTYKPATHWMVDDGTCNDYEIRGTIEEVLDILRLNYPGYQFITKCQPKK